MIYETLVLNLVYLVNRVSVVFRVRFVRVFQKKAVTYVTCVTRLASLGFPVPGFGFLVLWLSCLRCGMRFVGDFQEKAVTSVTRVTRRR